MLKAYFRVYETNNPDPTSNSAIGPSNTNPQALATALHGKMITKVTVISSAVEPSVNFYLSDGSALQVSIPMREDLYVDLLKKKI